MITAAFYKKNEQFYKFRISGHSGYAESGSDIVCAAVSSMAFLTANNITNSFSLEADISVNEENADLVCSLKSDDARGYALIAGLHNELCTLAQDYPKYIRVLIN